MSTRAMDVWMQALAGGLHEPTAKRVRARLRLHTVVDTKRALLVWEPRRIVPSYAVPEEELEAVLEAELPAPSSNGDAVRRNKPFLTPGDPFVVHTMEGDSLTVRVPGRTADSAAFRPADPTLAGYVILDYFSFDDWYEEDERIFGHPRSPFSHIDIRASSRHVRVEYDGEVLAESDRPYALFETGLPVRYYLPREDVRSELLSPSSTRTMCAYKGEASYWSVTVGDRTMPDLVWTYEQPSVEVVAIAGRLAFFNERVDVIVDGQRTDRPVTEFKELDWFEGAKR
jgi:uncharacterized protein (DUF427 family)